eukprot:CAMPEP_0172196280 /NCGR_PEP_ID=MMETSP1050-20130122/26725_1 /TAXON_ID=233186 /ORGANISM="Cryptomonas curvata, Strain CCAP979/52" /LENGTH=206 /DNA_ID=CAMNT_0012872535 /DNA_START=116 /DNA_END=732 /DNA_ORIENTATION=-
MIPHTIALFLFTCTKPSASLLKIERPRHHSVVRTQSVQIEIVNEGPSHFAILELDGRKIAEFQERHISLILADEQGMTEGIHNITWWTPMTDSKKKAVTSVFQFSRNFAPSAFGEIEIFVTAPTAGQLLSSENDLDVQLDVTNAHAVQFTAVVEIDGEILAELQNDFVIDSDQPRAAAQRVSSTLPGVPPGSHLMRIVLYSDGDDA